MSEPSGDWVFELPSLGADMENGTVLEWYVSPGDVLSKGDVVALVSTEKADIDVEIWQPGTVAEFLVDIGTEVPVGTPLLRLGGGVGTDGAPPAEPVAAEPVVFSPPEPAPPPPPAPSPAPAPPAPDSVPRPPEIGVVGASPLARAKARERGIDLATLTGTGPAGAILVRDLEAVGNRAAVEPPSDRAGDMRRVIAERMARANREIPHYHLELDVDLGPALRRLEDRNASVAVAARVLPAALFVQATARAARDTPELNGFWRHDGFEAAPAADVAVAISLRAGGLVTPKVASADQLTVDVIMSQLKDMVAGARRGSLRSSWMGEAGITLTNLGNQGVDRVHGVIFPPQVALVGVGRVADRPCVVDGQIVPTPMVTISLAADHRASDGVIGSRFLHQLAKHLQNWEVQ